MDEEFARMQFVLAAKPFVFEAATNISVARKAWEEAIHQVLCHHDACGCQTHEESCFMLHTPIEQDGLLSKGHVLSFISFLRIIEDSRDNFTGMKKHITPLASA